MRSKSRLKPGKLRARGSSSVVSVASTVDSAATGESIYARKRNRFEEKDDEAVELRRRYDEIERILEAMKETLLLRKSNRASKEKMDSMLDHLEEVKTLTKELAFENALLRRRKVSEARPTYAAMAGKGTEKLKIPPIIINNKKVPLKRKYTAIVPSGQTDKPFSSEQIKVEVQKCINPVMEGITIDGIRKIKEGIIIEMPAKQDLEKLVSNTAFGEHDLLVTEAKRRMPRIIIYDIPSDLTEEQILEALISQTEKVKEFNEKTQINRNVLDLKFKTGKRGFSKVNWVAEAIPERRNLMIQGRLYVEMRRFRVTDFTSITRCYNCQGLGHVAKFCKEI